MLGIRVSQQPHTLGIYSDWHDREDGDFNMLLEPLSFLACESVQCVYIFQFEDGSKVKGDRIWKVPSKPDSNIILVIAQLTLVIKI